MENEKVDNGEDEQEEQKVEEFFALIRSFQEARNRRKDQALLEEKDRKKKTKLRKLNAEEQASWVPSFEWEDFNQEIQFRKSPLIYPRPCNNQNEDKKQQEEDGGLDLNLTL
ncbi:hypothetical protein JCGZ_14079 [Jatropha curcas]|uniref:Uncharacterized protein n=1 Tax=Jatropha curcas TaxID=180498 RepID=A0A067JZV4_JATCU|nr:protein NIM1-INTERACTING 1 [Jatropha curcas]KDP28308.1 hypothetical protein JCGZ_14079 [Jatropha curcas]